MIHNSCAGLGTGYILGPSSDIKLSLKLIESEIVSQTSKIKVKSLDDLI